MLAEPITLIYLDAKSEVDKEWAQGLKQSKYTESLIKLLNDSFDFPFKLKVILGAKDGPLFDPERNEVHIPYAFMDEIAYAFDKGKFYESEEDAVNATFAVLEHTLYHEVGHAKSIKCLNKGYIYLSARKWA